MLPALNFEEQDEGQLIWEASRKFASLPPLGRVLNIIFNAEWRSIEKALSYDGTRAQQGAERLITQSSSKFWSLSRV